MKANIVLPSDWIEKHFYVPEPRDPVTGDPLPEGPIRLHPLQRRLVNEALRKDERNRFVYTTIIYSCPKKSGKSTIASACGLNVMNETPYSHGYCLANDGKQSTDRLYGPIYNCIELHNRLGGIFKKTHAKLTEVKLPNKSKIEAIPCDAAGEAGSEPTITLWSELWGYETEIKRRLFTEQTVPSTRIGRSIRWIETYAGFSGVSELLWGLYEQAVLQGTPHPDFLDITYDGKPVVFTNEVAGIFCYWDHEPRMAWQQGREGEIYYQQEASILSPTEFNRIHRNMWSAPVGSFIEPSMWDACADKTIPALGNDNKTPLVVAVDASETNDCTAVVVVSRHPVRPTTDVAVRYAKIFSPGKGGTILIEPTVGKTILFLGLMYNIIVIAFDAYQLAKLVQDYRRGNLTFTPDELTQLMREFGQEPKSTQEAVDRFRKAVQRWYYKYSQQSERSISDKMLYDLIVHRRIAWNPNDLDSDIAPRGDTETLTKHVKQAGVKTAGGQYRIQKLSNTMKIDGAVALSMACELCLRLNLSYEDSVEKIANDLRSGNADYNEFIERSRRVYEE